MKCIKPKIKNRYMYRGSGMPFIDIDKKYPNKTQCIPSQILNHMASDNKIEFITTFYNTRFFYTRFLTRVFVNRLREIYCKKYGNK